MPRYFFDIKDGDRLVDPAGRECENDAAAKEMANGEEFAALMVGMTPEHAARRAEDLRRPAPGRFSMKIPLRA